MNGLGYTFNIEDTDTFNTDSTQNPDTNVVAQAKALIDANDKVEDYNDYMSAVAAVKTAEATRDAFNGLQGALKMPTSASLRIRSRKSTMLTQFPT